MQPCLSAARSQMAWCGWLWLRLLSRPDRCMMNHIPAASRAACTHTRTGAQASGRAQPRIPAQLRAIPAKRSHCPLALLCMEINFNQPAGPWTAAAAQRAGKAEKSTKEQKRGGGRKLSRSPLLSGSLFFSLCDLCPWPGPIHVPQIAQLMPQ